MPSSWHMQRLQEYEHIGLFSRDEPDDTESEDSEEDEITEKGRLSWHGRCYNKLNLESTADSHQCF